MQREEEKGIVFLPCNAMQVQQFHLIKEFHQ